jgi:hypothetical protein
MPTVEQVLDVVRPVISETLGGDAAMRVTISHLEDFPELDALAFDIPSSVVAKQEIEPGYYPVISRRLRDALTAIGEERFAYVRLVSPRG